MRRELFWNPRLLVERLGARSLERRRLHKLRNTVARELSVGHLESLELIELAAATGVSVIYDVGANVGTWTLLAKAVLPHAKVEAFEPLPAHCDAYAARCGTVAGVRLHPIALGDQNGNATLRVTSFSDASSMLPATALSREHFNVTEVDRASVSVRRLDDYVAESQLSMPDLVKLDVQGYELTVLAGASAVLGHARALIVEVSFVELYENQSRFPDLCRALDEAGFDLHAFGPSTPLGRPLVQADALFLRRHAGERART